MTTFIGMSNILQEDQEDPIVIVLHENQEERYDFPRAPRMGRTNRATPAHEREH